MVSIIKKTRYTIKFYVYWLLGPECCQNISLRYNYIFPVHDMWKKRYYEEKKITPKLEEESAKLRQELERIHRYGWLAV